MLALPPQRQHHPTSAHSSSPQHQQFSFDQLAQQLSAQQLYDQKLLHDYLDSQQQSFNPAIVIDTQSNPFMTGAYDYSNPAIRIQQSTPTPQLSTAYSPISMLSTDATASGLDNWSSYGNVQSQSLQTPVSRSGRTHQRASSSSSIGSTGSQYQSAASAASYPYVAHSESSPSSSAARVDSSNNADQPSRAFSNIANHNLPTPTHTPTQDAFMNGNTFNNYTPHTSGMDSTMSAHMSMKQALMDQHVPDEDVPGFGHSARHSVSSFGHDSPATPHTTHGDDIDFKVPPTGETLHKVDSWLFNQFLAYDDEPDMRQHPVPKFERTYTDVAADYSFDPNVIVTQAQSQPSANALLSPYRTSNPNDIIQRSLQAAQIARSHSPSSSASRGDSPFRRSSPYRQPSSTFQSPRMAVGTAAGARELKVEADAAYAMKSQGQPSEESQPKTISPKDALLDYRDAEEDAKVPLFPDGGASEYDRQYNGGDQYRNATQSTFDTTPQSYQKNSWATPHFSPNFPTSVAGTSHPTSAYAFAQPSVQNNLHGLPVSFASTSNYRTAPSMSTASEQEPEFPAHLTSMESSCSEAGPDPSSQSSDRILQKPANSNADHGTYTCTYHGCTQRFETPQKLQKHKREGHRNAATISTSTTTATSMTAAALLERNSQAGPHKCERINPTTGKPCNTIFSRPYDLTRHEDTIHNARKQKVRCALCVEEKTFSRNDALTRHMRVVHPEVDFPGKHRRRGGNHD
jgi:hypothetical protein